MIRGALAYTRFIVGIVIDGLNDTVAKQEALIRKLQEEVDTLRSDLDHVEAMQNDLEQRERRHGWENAAAWLMVNRPVLGTTAAEQLRGEVERRRASKEQL